MSNAEKCKPHKVQNINADTNANGTKGNETSENCFSRLQFELNRLRKYLKTQSNDPEKQRNIGMYLLAIYKRTLASIKPAIITNLINKLKRNEFDAFFDYLLKNRESGDANAPYIITKQVDANTILSKVKSSYAELTDPEKNVAAIIVKETDEIREAFNAVKKEFIVDPKPGPEVIPASTSSGNEPTAAEEIVDPVSDAKKVVDPVSDAKKVVTPVSDAEEIVDPVSDAKKVVDPVSADATLNQKPAATISKLTIEVFVSSSDIKIKIEPATKVNSDEGAIPLTNATAENVVQSIIANMESTFLEKFNAIYGGSPLENASANSSRIMIELFVSKEDVKIKIGPVSESTPDESAISITAQTLPQEIQSILKSGSEELAEFLAQFSTLYS